MMMDSKKDNENFLAKRFKKADKIVSRHIEGEIIIVPVAQKPDGMGTIYSLRNDVEIRIWNLIDSKNHVREIVEIVKKEFDAKPEIIERDVIKFLKQIRDENLIIEC